MLPFQAGHSKADTEREPSFDQFWAAYPKRKGKLDAQRAWTKLHPSPALLVVLFAALEVQKHSLDWRKANGTYIPMPATWLRARRWEDEPDAPAPKLRDWACPHTPRCLGRYACHTLVEIAEFKAKAAKRL